MVSIAATIVIWGRCLRMGHDALHTKRRKEQSTKGIPKGKAEDLLETDNLSRFPLRPSEESEKPTEVSRRLFAYFLVGEKVGLRSKRIPTSLRSSE